MSSSGDEGRQEDVGSGERSVSAGEFKVGDPVQWKVRSGHRKGHVKEILTSDRDGHRASETHPKVIVVDDERQTEYARNPDKLEKVKIAEGEQQREE